MSHCRILSVILPTLKALWVLHATHPVLRCAPGPQLPVAVGLTGLDNTGQRMLVIDVEPNKLVHRDPPVQVGHGVFKRPRILPAARRLRFHSFCRKNRKITDNQQLQLIRNSDRTYNGHPFLK